jgi:Type I phosphodiesterase / nucleotide pyrophosphatase
LWIAADIVSGTVTVDSFGWAIAGALVAAAATLALQVLFGVNNDDTYSLRVTERMARRSGKQVRTDRPGVVFLEIDGLAFPVLQRAVRDGHAPEMARWLAAGTHRLVEWETDLSSQTGASQAGILLGSNDDIPAFRWVEKETGTLMTCSAPRDCAEIERRHTNGSGLLTDGGTSRGNLLSGGAEEVILTVSRIQAERGPNPGYRAFFSNGYNVTRASVLFLGEIVLELGAATRQRRRDIQPRGHRGGTYPFLRAAMCVVLRDLIAFSVISDVLRGRPAVYATFSSYDEVAHHSGLERHDTLEALRKVDKQIGRIARACRYAPRPYEIVVLSDHGQTQGATFKQRNGYGLDELVRRSVGARTVQTILGGDENETAVGIALEEARGTSERQRIKGGKQLDEQAVVVLASGNLGLVYLMDEPRRLTLEEIEARHPQLVPALRRHPHVGFVLARSAARGPVALGARGAHYLAAGEVEGDDPLAPFSANAARHLVRSAGFEHAPDLFVNSFYDPQVDEGCAFEELISFHGGMGGSQTRPFVLAPVRLPLPERPIVGAAAVHEVLVGWRAFLNHGDSGDAGQFETKGARVEFALPQP